MGLGPGFKDKKPVTIGAFHPPGFAQIQIHPRMAQGPAIPITGYTVLVGFNGLRCLKGHELFSIKPQTH